MAKKERIPDPRKLWLMLSGCKYNEQLLSSEISVGKVLKRTVLLPWQTKVDGLWIDEVAVLFLEPGAEILFHTHKKGQYEAYFDSSTYELCGRIAKPGEGHNLCNHSDKMLIIRAIKWRRGFFSRWFK